MQAEILRGGLEVREAVEAGDAPLPAVVYEHQLHVPAGADAGLGAVLVDLVDHEDAPDAVNAVYAVPQDPLPAHAHGTEPPAVLPEVAVHRGEELLHRRGLLRVGQLAADGFCQGAFGREEGVPDGGIGQIEPAGHQQGAAGAAEGQSGIVPGFPIGPVLPQAHGQHAQQRAACRQHQQCPDQPGEPLPGAAETKALRPAVGVVFSLESHQHQDDGDGQQAQRHGQQHVDHRVPGPAQKAAFVLLGCHICLLLRPGEGGF